MTCILYLSYILNVLMFFSVDRYDIQYKEATSEVWSYYDRIEKPFKTCSKQDDSQTQGNLLKGIDNCLGAAQSVVQLNKFETGPFFLHNFQCTTMFISLYCKVCELSTEHESVFASDVSGVSLKVSCKIF